jgi:hypothetical protein
MCSVRIAPRVRGVGSAFWAFCSIRIAQGFNQCAILQYSKTPSLRSPEFEDEDDDEDENEALLTLAPFAGVVRPIGRRLA